MIRILALTMGTIEWQRTWFAGEYSRDPKKRDLQHEAKAHITVHRWIDGGHLRGGATTRPAFTLSRSL